MAITTPTLVEHVPKGAIWLAKTGTFASGGYLITPTPATGRLYITEITLSLPAESADIYVTLYDDAGGLVLLGPVDLQDAGASVFVKRWRYPLALTPVHGLVGTALIRATDDPTTCHFYIEGFTA